MKKKFCKLTILLVMLSLLTVSALAQAPAMQWHQTYNGSEEESHPHYVIETSDGGFLMVGETGFIPNSAKIYVVKTNSSGGLLWQKEFGSRGYNLGNGCVETPDGNYVIAGTLNYDAALIKVDASTGNALSGWPKTWNLGSEDSFEAVENTQDGGLIATGYRNGLAESTFLNWGQGNLIKTDANGNQIWNKDISAYMHSGYRMKRISDGYMVSGHPATEGQPDYNLMKFDFDGNVVWYKTPYAGIYWGFDVDASGNMILAGHVTNSPLSNNHDLMTVKVDSGGNVLWTEYAGQPRGYNGDYIHDEAWGARATPDGGYVVIAGSGDEYSYSECGHPLGCSDQWIVYFLKYTSTGTLEWEGLYGGTGDWAGEDVCITSDGGALIANDCGAFGFTKIEPFGAPDTDPPTPDPMTWAAVPSADGESSISMTATTASDPSGVEYYFDETSGNPGGTDSGWQSSPSYTDTGLNASTQYCYQVKARDLSANNNETAYSSTQCDTTTTPDTAPPTPDPMNWSVMPYSTGTSSIAMSAVTASDPSGVEYYFEETSGNPGGSDSGWQDSTSYEDAGLDPQTQYTYHVKARDKSPAQNETAYSSSQSATTDAAPQWTVIISDDFEGGFGNWNDGGSDCSLYTSGARAHQGNNAVDIQDNSTPPASTTYTNNLALSGYDDVKVDFWYYCYSMDNSNEDFWLDISTNGGSDWTAVEEWNQGDEFVNEQFYPESVIITGYTLTDQTQLRFRCDASGNADDVYIDEVVVSAGGGTPPETDPPTPDPATWSSVPSADSDTAISMTATTGSDASPPVEYYFDETSGNPGGSDSGWQTSASYTDTGLIGSTQYTYRIQMRDSLGNTGGYSTSESATTNPTVDTDPPTPDPATWSSVPSADSDTAISMTATTGSDANPPVEYSFDETSGNPGGSDSGWQTSASYTDSGLNASTQYTYRVQMRDSIGNTGGYSTSESATTQAAPDTTPPTPDPLTWQSLPSADSGVAISMQATTASDPSGVEYYFNNVT
ncbi:MAG: phage tail protein, partial [Planctomycetota bacterium]